MVRLDLVDWRWVVRLAVTLLALSILPVLLAVLLDWRLHTFPVVTLFMLLLGLNLGIYTITRQVAVMYSQISPMPSDTPSKPVGGDPC